MATDFRGAGIPVCDTGANTPVNQFTWQDLFALAFTVPWHNGAVYLMNQRTFGQVLTRPTRSAGL